MQVQDLSFNPGDPFFSLPGDDSGIQWAVQAFTTENVFGVAEESSHIELLDDEMTVSTEVLTWAGGQQRVAGWLHVRVRLVRPTTWVWEIRAELHGAKIKSVKVKFRHLPQQALEGGWWHAGSDSRKDFQRPSATSPLRWVYPDGMGWQTPWACAGEMGPAVCVSVRDDKVRPVRLYVHTPPYETGPIVEIVSEEAASAWNEHYISPPIRLTIAATSDDLDSDFTDHLNWISRAYALEPWESRPDVPPWVRKIRLILNLHGQHYTGYVFNTFRGMADALRYCTKHIPGEQVLAFLPGWEGRYYFAYPQFQPAEMLGGDDGFRYLIDTARELGVRLMPMFGAHGANAAAYPAWRDVAFRNGTGQLAQLPNIVDWDSDRAGEDFIAFLNTANPDFQKYLIGQIDAMVTSYGLDIIYLDTTAHYSNDSRHDLYEGYKTLIGELRYRHPDLAIAGEGWYDALLGIFPINMSWAGIHRPVRKPELPANYTRTFQHLVDGAPGLGSTGVYEGGFAGADHSSPVIGHLPSVSIVEDTLSQHAAELAEICRDAAL